MKLLMYFLQIVWLNTKWNQFFFIAFIVDEFRENKEVFFVT